MYRVTVTSFLGNNYQLYCDDYSLDPNGLYMWFEFGELELNDLFITLKVEEIPNSEFLALNKSVDWVVENYDYVLDVLKIEKEKFLKKHGFLRSYEL